jgi:methyl-accepting chemotaxis protein
MSRLKKKLLLYFILVSIVSISVSAEIILEMSSARFRESIQSNYEKQMAKQFAPGRLAEIEKKMDYRYVFAPISNLRNRMILLLVVVSVSIVGALFMFTRDIVSPMDGMVEATKKIAGGDLTCTVPVMSEDEIGQVAGLINDMNVNLQDMIMQIRQEISRHMEQIVKVSYKMGEVIQGETAERALKEKRISAAEFRKILRSSREVFAMMETMSDELFALQKFVKMYKTYGQHTEILQSDIDKAFQRFTAGTMDRDRD